MDRAAESQARLAASCGFSRHRLFDLLEDSLKDLPMKKNARLWPLLALSLLTACVVPAGPVEVTRFHRAAEGMPYGTGSFAIALVGGSVSDQSLAGSPYLAAVAREMQRIGYRDDTGNADVIAEVRFGATVIRADRRAPAAQPDIAASKLAAALFKDFPGVSGETIRIA